MSVVWKNEQVTDIADLFCDPCKNDGQTLPVEGYCVNCDEYLCNECYKVHCRPSLTRHHVLQEKHVMPRQHAYKPDQCTIHDGQVIEYYCEDHEDVCCPICRDSNHGKCKDIKSIDKVLSGKDIKQEFVKLQGSTKLLKNDINKTQYMVETSQKAVLFYHDKARNMINDHHERILKQLEENKGKLERKVKLIQDEDEKKIIAHKNLCEAMYFDTNIVESYVQAKISTNKKYDAFIGIKRAQKKININHGNLEKIRTENKVTRYDITPGYQIRRLSSKESCIGELNMKENVTKSSQFITGLNARHVQDSQKCEITSLSIISESLVAAADKSNKNVKIIDTNMDEIKAVFSLSSPPCEITVVPEHKLVVTLPEEKMIQFLSVALPEADSVTPERSISVSGTCNGIDYIGNEGKLIISYNDQRKVEILNMDGKVDRSVDLDLENLRKISVVPNTSMVYIYGSHSNYLSLVDLITKSIVGRGHEYQDVKSITHDKHGVCTYLCSEDKVFVIVQDSQNKCSDRKLKTVHCLANYKIYDAGSIAFCDSSLRLYIGAKGDNIMVYFVA